LVKMSQRDRLRPMAKSAHEPPAFTVEKQRPAHWFKPGESGNAKGRPPGAKSVFSQDFIKDVHAAWIEHGEKALRLVAETEPAKFLAICAGLMPRDIQLSADLRVEHAVSALEAYRLLKATPTTELRQIGLKAEHAND
jgi:uncharacterized protein DUF5681